MWLFTREGKGAHVSWVVRMEEWKEERVWALNG